MKTRTLFIDYETRSAADLSVVGAHRYCLDSSTEMLLVAYAFDDDPVEVRTQLPAHVIDALENHNVRKVAHNAEFDMCVTSSVCDVRINYSDWYDTAYAAAYYGYPRKLQHLATCLNTTAKGSQEELRLFSEPIKFKKKDLANITEPQFNHPAYFTKEWERFKEYARTDVVTMREIYRKLAELPPIEIFAMQETFAINFEGVPFDRKLGKRIYDRSQQYSSDAQSTALQNYGIANLRSVKQVKEALKQVGIDMESLNAKTRGGVEHEILELRDQAAGSAFAKIPKAFARVCPDDRLRGEFVGYGAHTGRWSSRGVQLQNWARILGSVHEDMIHVEDYAHLRQHMRLCLGYTPGKNFVCGDLSQIEARIVAWLANCKWRMDAFANGVDIYARSAEKMFNIPKVEKGDIERQYGKCAELGFGYGGGKAAIKNIQPDFYAQEGEERIQKLVDQWRAANEEICQLWRSLEKAFRTAYKSGTCEMMAGKCRLKFMYSGGSMKLQLPSGRALYYRKVFLSAGTIGDQLNYLDYSRGGEKPIPQKLWGGTLLENVTQAIARDVLVSIMHRLKIEHNMQCIGTVHDELWYLCKPNVNGLQAVLQEMERPIAWASGLVTKGDGQSSDRYRKS